MIRTVRSVAAVPLVVTAIPAAGLYLLDDPSLSIGERATNALRNTVKTLTTIVDYTDQDLRQKDFLITLVAVLIAVGAYSISSLAESASGGVSWSRTAWPNTRRRWRRRVPRSPRRC